MNFPLHERPSSLEVTESADEPVHREDGESGPQSGTETLNVARYTVRPLCKKALDRTPENIVSKKIPVSRI